MVRVNRKMNESFVAVPDMYIWFSSWLYTDEHYHHHHKQHFLGLVEAMSLSGSVHTGSWASSSSAGGEGNFLLTCRHIWRRRSRHIQTIINHLSVKEKILPPSICPCVNEGPFDHPHWNAITNKKVHGTVELYQLASLVFLRAVLPQVLIEK